MLENKILLFSVTASDCEWSYTKGSGKGGQKRNKTSSAVHCKHKNSGATGYSEDTRSQHKNKQLAFQRMTNTKEFKQWHTVEVSRKTGELEVINRKVEQEMKKIKIEIKNNSRWVEQKQNG